jgi:hypothetical protein
MWSECNVVDHLIGLLVTVRDWGVCYGKNKYERSKAQVKS